MKNALLIAGIAGFAVSVLSLLFSALNHFGYRNLLDGSPEHYGRLRRRTELFCAVGIILAVAGTACFVIRSVI